jgi:hypothetical protein
LMSIATEMLQLTRAIHERTMSQAGGEESS